jgi:LemA protein
MSSVIMVVGLLVLAALYLVSMYNRFVSLKTRIEASIQEIGNQLKRQADLIPNLTNSVKGYLKHEKEIFKMLTDARKSVMDAVSKGSAQGMIDASATLQQALAPIRVVLESNPQLASAGTVTKLMDELRDTADKVMYSRRTLIDLTADYNIMIVSFPSNLIASLFQFAKMPGLTMPEGAEGATTVKSEDLATPKIEI